MARAFVADAVARGAVAVLGAPELAAQARALGVQFHRGRESARCGWPAGRGLLSAPSPTPSPPSPAPRANPPSSLPARDLDRAGHAGRQPRHRRAWSRRRARCRCSTPRPIRWKLHRLLAQLKARRRRSSGARSLQPWPGSVPAGRRGDRGRRLHQHHPRSHGLSRRPSRITSPPSCACSPKWCATAAWRWSTPTPTMPTRFIAAARQRGLQPDHRGRTRRDHQARRAQAAWRRRRRWRVCIRARAYDIALPLAGAFQASNALVAAGLAHRPGRGRRTRCSRRWRHLKGAPGRMEKVAYRRIAARRSMSITPIRRTALEKVLTGAAPARRRQAACRVRLRRRPRQGQASADGRSRRDASRRRDRHRRQSPQRRCRRHPPRSLAGARARARSATAPRPSAPASRRSAAGDVLVIAGKGHETGQYVGGEDASLLRPRRSGEGRAGAGRARAA